MGGTVKEKVFEKKPYTVDELKEFISQVFMDINANRSLYVSVHHNVGYMHFKHLKSKHDPISTVHLLLAHPLVTALSFIMAIY